MSQKLEKFQTLPWWVLQSGKTTPVTPPPTSPDLLTSWYLYYSARDVTLSGSNVTQNNDMSGNGRNSPWSVSATYDSTGYDGNPMIQNGATSLAAHDVGTNIIAAGTAHCLWFLIWDTSEAGTYYHCLLCLRTSTGFSNQNIVVSNDSAYGFFFNILGSGTTSAIGPGVKSFTARPVSVFIDYNGGSITSAASYACYIDNTLQTLSTQTGGAGNNDNKNFLNSYANTSPPAFPFKNCRWSEIGLKVGATSDATLRANVKTWLQYRYPSVTQA